MSEEKHILTKLETIYFGKKENEKLTMHEIGIVLDYVALLEQNNRYKNGEIERLNNVKNDLLYVLEQLDGYLDKGWAIDLNFTGIREKYKEDIKEYENWK